MRISFFFTFGILGIILVGLVPTANAEVGQNFDRTQIGPKTFQWQSHYERILDNGQFVNYKLNDDGNIITFESANIIFKLDKNTCSFSLSNPETKQVSIGSFTHDLIIDGLVQPSSCSVTSTTQATDGIDVKVSRVGISGSFITTYHIDQKKSFPLELVYDLTNSTKVSKIGVVDTCVGCNGISLGGDLIKFGDYIMDTENRIHNSLKSTDDTKGDYTITYEGDALPVGQKLVIDPTFSGAATNSYEVRTGLPGVGVTCPTTGSVITPGNTQLYIEDADLNVNFCDATAFRFNVTSIPVDSIVTNSSFQTVVGSVSTPKNCDINEVLHDPSTADATALWNDILNSANGTTWLNNNTWCTATGGKDLDLGTGADSGFQSIIQSGADIISIGYVFDDMTRDSTSFHEVVLTGSHTLTLTYQSTSGNAVTDLHAFQITGTSVILEWTQPDLHNGTLTGYQINSTTPWSQPLTIIVNDTANSLTRATVSGLTEQTQYSFRASARTELGTNQTGNILNVTTLSDFSVGTLNLTASNTELVPIMFERNDINDTALFLNVTYSNTFHLACDFHYKFVQTNRTYTNLANVTVAATRVRSDFQFNGVNNEIIDVFCWNDNAGGMNSTNVNNTNSGRYIITQTEFVLLQQIANFRNGVYGTGGMFGVLDMITLMVVIIGMIGLNRTNEGVGAFFLVALVGAMAFFDIVEWTTFIASSIALVVMLGVAKIRE